MANFLGNLDILGSTVDHILPSIAQTAGGVVDTTAALGATVGPVIAPVVDAAAPIANLPLDLANPVVEPVVSTVSGIVGSLLPLTGEFLSTYLGPANGSLHLPVTGDHLTPLFGEAASGSSPLGPLTILDLTHLGHVLDLSSGLPIIGNGAGTNVGGGGQGDSMIPDQIHHIQDIVHDVHA